MAEVLNNIPKRKLSKICLWAFYGFNIFMLLILLMMYAQTGLTFFDNILSVWANIDIIIAAFYIFTKKLKEPK